MHHLINSDEHFDFVEMSKDLDGVYVSGKLCVVHFVVKTTIM